MNVESSQTEELLVKTNKLIFVKPWLKPKLKRMDYGKLNLHLILTLSSLWA